MSQVLKIKIVALILMLLFNSNIKAQNPANNIPQFQFFKFDKTSFTNKNIPDHKKVFFCFFDITCEHCQHVIESVNLHYSEFSKTEMYFISLDSKDGINKFLNKFGSNLLNKKNVTLLFDLKNQFISKFQPKKYPSLFLFSSTKKLLLYSDDETKFSSFLSLLK